jgi:hypothetical protein
MATNRKMLHVYATEEETTAIKIEAERKGLSISKYFLSLHSVATTFPRREVVTKPDRTVPDNGVPRGAFVAPPRRKGGSLG